MSNPKATIYIVEDDRSFLKSVERLVRAAGYESIGLGSATLFLEQEALRHPSCLLLDVRLPDLDGLLLQETLADRGISLPIIFMTGHGDIPMSVKAMKRGAIDFLPKPFGTEDLLAAIAVALKCDSDAVEHEHQKNKVGALVDALTPRELEILRWVITGRLNKQIADALGICEKTVKVHRARVLQKAKVSSVAELVRFAERANISPAE